MTDDEKKKLTKARDDLRRMFNLGHMGGPHATRDAPAIENAILTLDVIINPKTDPQDRHDGMCDDWRPCRACRKAEAQQ